MSFTSPSSYFPVQSQSSVLINVGRSGVAAKIKGGMFQTAFTNATLFLDATPSQDIDYPHSVVQGYSWTCKVVETAYGSDCPGFLNSNQSFISFMTATPNIFLFTVYVTNSFGDVDMDTCQVRFVVQNIPTVSIFHYSKSYNFGDSIIFSGKVTSSNVARLSWSSSNFTSATMSTLSLTPLTGNFSSGVSIFQLALLPKSLLAGLSYTFQLSAKYLFATTASIVSITVYIREPPKGGVLFVTPLSGIAYDTKFYLQTSRWVSSDANFPITYDLSYYVLDPTTQKFLKDSNSVPYTTAMLSQGLTGQNYQVICVATATDVYGGYANTTANVTVVPSVNILNMSNSIHQNLLVAYQEESGVTILQLVGSISGSLRNILCDVNPSCATLHRLTCSTKSNMCGACKEGYIGVDDSNIPCQLNNALLNGAGKFCSTNSSCLSGKCSAGKCMDSLKPCPSDCSGHGSCMYVGYDGSSIVGSCFSSDGYCSAMCNCAAGWYGSDCSLTKSQFTEGTKIKQDLYYSVLQSKMRAKLWSIHELTLS